MALADGLNKVLPQNESNIAFYEQIKKDIQNHGLAEVVKWDFKSYEGQNGPKYKITEKGKDLMKNNDLFTFLIAEDFKASHPEIYDEKVWDEYFCSKIEKRADQAEFFFDIIVSEKLLQLEKPEIRKYFKQWFKETQTFDLQIKNGDLAIEDGDLQIVPDFDKSNITEFVKWFNQRKEDFLTYLKDHGVTSKDEMKKQTINNNGNLIINEQSHIKEQSIKADKREPNSNWIKANVIIALIVGIATVIGVIWGVING